MVYVTKGIVLHHINYSESSVIIKVFTELYGLQSFIIKGFRKPKSKYKKTLIQPLTIVEIVAYFNNKSEIHLLKELNIFYQADNLYLDIRKSAIAFFIDEILFKSIKESEPNKPLFDFVLNSVIHLNSIDKKLSLFNLFFIIQLTKYLGFFPELNYSDKHIYFDLVDGTYIPDPPIHSLFIEPEHSFLFYQIAISELDNYHLLSIDYKHRTILLTRICDYYGVHISGFKNIKSAEIFEKIFNN